jgi:type VI protein secretion system component Hcp
VERHRPEKNPRPYRLRRRQVLVGVAALVGLIGLDGGVARALANPTMAIDSIGSFEILSYSWQSSSGSTQGVVKESKADGISFTKEVDEFSTALSSAVASGTSFASASLTVTGKNGKPIRYEMTDVLITSYLSNAGTPTPTETITLQFSSLKVVRR